MRVQVRNNTAASRYELVADEQVVAVADYRVLGSVVVMPHTEVLPSMRGQGLGGRLVQAALDDVRRTGRSVVPRCWYVAEFIGEHPEYADLVAA